MTVTLQAVADVLAARTTAARYDDVPVIWRTGRQSVQRLGLALELRAGMDTAELDALVLHRPFRLPPDALPGVGILAAHAAFDAHLTTGYNPALAAALGMRSLRPVEHDGELMGMTGWLPEPLAWRLWEARLQAEFDGLDVALAHGVNHVAHIAVVSAMNESLVEQMLVSGVDTMLIGELRLSGRATAAEHHLAVVVAGDERVEQWGLRRLAAELAGAFPALEIRVLS